MIEYSVGYKNIHPDEGINFQLNRWLPNWQESEVRAAAENITDFQSWIHTMLDLAKLAEDTGRMMEAAFYYRAAEFFIPDGACQKLQSYEKFVELFWAHYSHEGIERDQVPFDDGFLPALRISPEGPARDTILIHGGFDSFMEEFMDCCEFFRSNGYEVIIFEGPGQGNALKKYGLRMIPQWEKPVGAVLDHFQINSCTLLGISLGGCLATRAAAFEDRIKRVIAYDVLDDLLEILGSRMGTKKFAFIKTALRFGFSVPINRAVARMAREDDLIKWAIEHGQYVSGTPSAFEYFKWQQGLETRSISHLVTQDYLLLAGESDHFVPLEQFHRQARNLINVRSFTGRIFTEYENAQNHCQVGNIPLLLDTIESWLSQIEKRDQSL